MISIDDKLEGMICLVVICIIIIIMGILRRRAVYLFRFLYRVCLGLIIIYGMNYIFANYHSDLYVGYNVISVLTSGILGFPGIAALYCIRFMFLL